MNIPDNYDQWKRYDAEQCKREARLPECDYCGEIIQDDHYYLINDETICPACLESYFRKEIEDYIE